MDIESKAAAGQVKGWRLLDRVIPGFSFDSAELIDKFKERLRTRQFDRCELAQAGPREVVQLGDLEIKFIKGSDMAEVIQDILYVIKSRGVEVLVRSTFKCDGASIPRFFWRFIGHPWLAEYRDAAVLHDALYASELFPREICDSIFEEYMRQLDIPAWKRKAMWLAVRMGGGAVWANHTNESVEDARKLVLAAAVPA